VGGMTIRLTISYGHDVHSIDMDEKTYAAIKAGQNVRMEGQGFSHEEDGAVQDHWVFNRKPGEIFFWLDNGAEYHAQKSWTESAKSRGV
jgi:hypothetical protein